MSSPAEEFYFKNYTRYGDWNKDDGRKSDNEEKDNEEH